LFGVCVVSLTVATITSTLEMSTKEGRAFLILERLRLKQDIDEAAVMMLSGVGKIKLRSNNLGQINKLIQKVFYYTGRFKELKR